MLITLEEARRGIGNEVSDELLEGVITAAGEMIEEYLGRKIEYGQYADVIRADWPPRPGGYAGGEYPYLVKAYPIDQIESIEAARPDREGSDEIEPGGYNNLWQDGSAIDVDAERGIVYLPRAAGTVKISYTGGYFEIPQAIKQACALIAASLIGAIESGGREVASETLEGYSVSYVRSTATGTAGIAGLSPAAACLINPYRARGAIG